MLRRVIIGCCVVLFLTSTLSFGQQQIQKEPATKLERFLSKKGKLLVKEFHKAGNLAGEYGAKIKVDALTIYEPGKESEKIKGLKIAISAGGKRERTDNSFLDIEEMESLSQAITYMVTLLQKWQGQEREYTEVVFSTIGNFKLGFFQKGISLQAFASSGIIGPARCYFLVNQLQDLKSIIDKGKSLLAQ